MIHYKRNGVTFVHSDNAIDEINSLDPSALRFHHFKNLKSGLDRFSKMKLAQLIDTRDPNVVEVCAMLLPDIDEKLVTLACRWAARGLRPELAVRKVYTDGSIASAAVRRNIRDRIGAKKRPRPAPENQRDLAGFE